MKIFLFLLLALAGSAACEQTGTNPPFALRGYYTTFMRMPTFGLPEWKQMIDCMHEDEANLLILWTAGGFRSKRYPITWQYNADHKNVEHDFVRELIDYAHTKQMRVLLGFTPFAYDGVNQFPLEHPDLKATQKNGEPARFWGMHAWGYNLCPAREASQRFMRDYVREMLFEFYPNADGLLVESSDYAICHCRDCGEKFFEHEFAFVRRISEEVWAANSNAMVLVYPHYFSGRKVPGFDVAAAKQPFDPRWSLFFTPHSAPIDDHLVKQARSSVHWNDGLTVGTPARIRNGARTAQQRGLTGFITSCEPFSCVDGPPGSGKPRQKPFHFEWLRDGEMPLNELLVRVNRIAYREFTRNPGLSDAAFRTALGEAVLGKASNGRTIDDLLFLQDCWFNGADWFTSAPLLRPLESKKQAVRENWPDARMESYRERVKRLRGIAGEYATSTNAAERELARVAALIVRKWDDAE